MKRNKRDIQQFIDRVWPTPPPQEVEAACDRVWQRLEEDLKHYDTSLLSLSGDGWSAPAVNQRELQVLTAAAMLGGQGDIHRITNVVETWTGGTMIGKVYAALCRLEERGLMTYHRSAPAEKGGEPEIRFEVTEDGDRALRRAKAEGKQVANAQEDEAKGRCY